MICEELAIVRRRILQQSLVSSSFFQDTVEYTSQGLILCQSLSPILLKEWSTEMTCCLLVKEGMS